MRPPRSSWRCHPLCPLTTWQFFNLIYNDGPSLSGIFVGFALINLGLHVLLWLYWGKCAKYHPRWVEAGGAEEAVYSEIEQGQDTKADGFELPGPVEQPAGYIPICERPFWTQVNPCVTPEFTYIVVFGVVNMTRSNLFLGLLADDLKQKGDSTKLYTKLASGIVPLGFLAVPLIDKMIRSLSLLRAMDITLLLGVVYGLVSLIPDAPIQLLTALLYTLYRALVFSVIGTYNAQVFGPATMGKVAGAMYTIAAPFQLLSYPLVALTQDVFGNRYEVINGFQITWLIPVYALSLWLRKHTREVAITGLHEHTPLKASHSPKAPGYSAVRSDEPADLEFPEVSSSGASRPSVSASAWS